MVSARFRLPFIAALLALPITLIPVFDVAQAQLTPTAPKRFTVTLEGTAGKPDVLLIPGLTSSRKVWEGEAALLASDYRLHLIQLNGFGGQPAGVNAGDAALLPAIVDELHGYIKASGKQPMIVGHSLGGLLALMLAAKYPDDVSRLVIVDALPFYGLMFGPQATVQTVEPMARRMRDATLGSDAAQRTAIWRQTAETLVLSPAGRALVEADEAASDSTIVAKAMFEDLQTDFRPELGRIRAPVLVLYAFDPTLVFPGGMKPTAEMADAITTSAYRGLSGVRLVRVDNTRHFIMLDQPQRFDELLRPFLGSRKRG